MYPLSAISKAVECTVNLHVRGVNLHVRGVKGLVVDV